MINKMKTLKVLKYIGFGILGLGLFIAFLFMIQALWNWLIPVLFHGPVITFWQGAGLFLLSKILLTGVAPGSHRSNHRKDWRKNFREKYHRQVDIADQSCEKV
jgi:hypothetical protein